MAGATRGWPPAVKQAFSTLTHPVSEGFLPSQTAKTTRPTLPGLSGGLPAARQQLSRPPALMSKADFNAYKKIKIKKINRRRARPAAIIICTTSCFLSRASFISHCLPFQVGPWAPRCSAPRVSSTRRSSRPGATFVWQPSPPPPAPAISGTGQLSRRRLLIVCQSPFQIPGGD